jgi:hypothetical protein
MKTPLAGLTMAALALAGCASRPLTESRLDKELNTLVALYAGAYLSPVTEGARPDAATFYRVVAIAPPAGARHALYAEMRRGDAQGPVIRQRLFLFDESPGRSVNRLIAHSFADPAAAEALVRDPALVAAGRLAHARSLEPAGCDMIFRPREGGFVGRIEATDCAITGRRGDTLRLESETVLGVGAIEQIERGFGPDGGLRFGNPEGRRYVWPRVPTETVR